ncbi:hypothetical protein [Escherichia phage PJNS034]
MGKFFLKLVKIFNMMVDIFVLYVLLFGHMSANIGGKLYEFNGLFL